MAMISDQDKDLLRGVFNSELQNPVRILAFTKRSEKSSEPGMECEFCNETEELMMELTSLSDKISVEFREYSPNDEMVQQLGIDKLPALILTSGDGKGVRYFGIPGGFEFSSLIADIVDVSRNTTDMTQDAREKVRNIDKDVHIQVFVTPTCPYCPSTVRLAHQMAIENPGHIQADAVEAAEFPHLVEKYGIDAVPTVVINDTIQFEGAPPEGDFADQVVKAAA